MPHLGSDPSDSAPGSGYISVKEYAEILQEAKKFHIEIIPEVSALFLSSQSVKFIHYSLLCSVRVV